MANRTLSADEKRWRAESDAETMARYEEIMGDATRRRAAINAARNRAADLNKQAGVMSRVASTRSSKTTSKKK